MMDRTRKTFGLRFDFSNSVDQLKSRCKNSTTAIFTVSFIYLLCLSVGEHNTQRSEGSEAEYRVKRIHAHPDYQLPTSLNNDIAMFELEKPIQFNNFVQPVCLPDKDVPVGTECYITSMYAIS